MVLVALDAPTDLPNFGSVGRQISLELYFDELAVSDRSGFDQLIGPAGHQLAF